MKLPVYNANHLFGFFSIFNGDALKSVEPLIKVVFLQDMEEGFHSVIDLQMKDGTKKKIHGESLVLVLLFLV